MRKTIVLFNIVEVRKMGRMKYLGVFLLAIIIFTGCSNSENTDEMTLRLEWASMEKDFENINQKTEIYSADGELLLSITDNEEIFYFIKNLELDKWDYSVNQIPPEAKKLCVIAYYRERDGEMREDGKETIYYDENGYYSLDEFLNNAAAFQTKMSNQAAFYLIELAGVEISDSSSTFAEDYEEKYFINNMIDYLDDIMMPMPFDFFLIRE